MNLLFLVEGAKTEPKIYRSWLKFLFPGIQEVLRPEDMINNNFQIIAGCGYPNMVSRPRNSKIPSLLEACMLDLSGYSAIDYLIICIDSENETYQNRFDEITQKINQIILDHPKISLVHHKIYVIIQHCCIETWALGNNELTGGTSSLSAEETANYEKFREYYDIALKDPETMECCPPHQSFRGRQRFHQKYLQYYFRMHGLKYSKNDPSEVQKSEYFLALCRRCQSTGHLQSFQKLVQLLEKIKNDHG